MLVIGVLGGLAMGAVAAARRTQSSFPTYLASTNPPDLEAQTGLADPTIADTSGYDARLVAKVGKLPHVKRAATLTIFNPEIAARGASRGDRRRNHTERTRSRG